MADLRKIIIDEPEETAEVGAIEMMGVPIREFAFSTVDTAFTSGSSTGGSGTRIRKTTLDRLMNDATPAAKHTQIRRSMEWSERDDLVQGLVRVKTDFTTSGFNIACAPEVSSGNENEVEFSAFEVKLAKIKRKWDFYALTKKLLSDWFTCDSMILYWKIDPKSEGSQSSSASVPPKPRSREALVPGLQDITALNPGDIDWNNSFGNDVLRVAIPIEIRNKIQYALRLYTKAEREEALMALVNDEGIPFAYIKAVKTGDSMVALNREDGHNWIVKTNNRKHHGLAKPSMANIFLPLETRNNCTDGDFATSFMMKHFMLHAKMGESITQGPLAGQKNNWAKQDDIDALTTKLKDTSQAAKIVTNHTVSFDFIFPPNDMFSGEKYKKPEERIFNWAGVTVVVFTGDGGNYGSGFLGVKRLMAHLVDARTEVKWVLSEFFDHDSIVDRIETPENCVVSAGFDENVLKEPAQLLNELRFLAEYAWTDPRTAHKELGRDPDSTLRQKAISKAEEEKTKLWSWPEPPDPFGDKGGEHQNPGRPGVDGNPDANEGTRTQPPAGAS
jgi:hypothetical protein